MMVFVTGTQVSGIGLAARLLHELGFVFGDEVAAGSGAGVDFQRRDVARICERLLASAGASWDCPRLLTDAYWARAWAGPHDALRQSAEQLLSSLGGRARVAVADVGLCLTLPFWRRIMRAPVPVVLCLRDPFELAEHLSATHGVSENFGLRLWETYLENAVLHTTAEQRIVLTYRELVDRPRRAASKLTARILSASPRRSSGMASPAGPTTPEAVNALGSSTGEHWRRPRHARLRALYEQLSAEAEESREGLETTDLDMPARKLIVHYHLYKNAGTSVDRILERSFGRDRWVKYEGNGTHLTSDDMTRFVGLNPRVVAISSHVADIRPPTIRGVQVFPVVFLRHPLDRIASVYRFERRQQLDAPGPNRAKELDLRAYVEWRMTHDGVFRNFQTRRLARYSETSSPGDDSALVRALIAADRLPFIGIVEEFDRSIARLSVLLSPHFPELRCTAVNENVTQSPNLTLAQRLRGLRDALGDRLFEDVLRANQDDLVLYGAVRLTSDGS